MKNSLNCKVAYVYPDKSCIVLNKGSVDGIVRGMTFLIYNEGDSIRDPDTGEDLGTLEIVCGRGVVCHVQKRCATVKLTEAKVKKVKICSPRWMAAVVINKILLQYDHQSSKLTFEGAVEGSIARYLDSSEITEA